MTRESSVHFQQGERLRIRSKGPQGQPFEAFWYTVPYAMTLEEVALQFAQTGQPGMLLEIVSGKVKWTFRVEHFAGHPSVTRVRGLPGAAAVTREAVPEPVDDPFYVIQGLYKNGHGTGEEFGFDDEEIALSEAKKLLRDPWFGGDYVRIITRDGDLVWDSRGGEPSGYGTWLLPPDLNEVRRVRSSRLEAPRSAYHPLSVYRRR